MLEKYTSYTAQFSIQENTGVQTHTHAHTYIHIPTSLRRKGYLYFYLN